MGSQEIIILFVIYGAFLFWNIYNEVAVNMFWNTGDKKYIADWHKYDTIFRLVFFPLVIVATVGFVLGAIKIAMIMAILYRPIFNIGFNYRRNRDTFKVLTFKEKINVLLYLSHYSIIDSFIIKINNWFYKIVASFFGWLSKITKGKINVRHNVTFQYFNLLLIIIEITLVVFIAIWL